MQKKKVFIKSVSYLVLSSIFIFPVNINSLFAQSSKNEEDPVVKAYLDSKNSDSEKEETFKYTKEKTVPEKKRPRKPSADEIEKSAAKNEAKATDEYVTQCGDTFKYGLEDEISELLDELTKNDDLRFVDPIYDLFFKTKSPSVRNKILSYFTKLKDPCLGNYACEIINDPYDEKNDTVSACFKYVSEAKIEEAIPGLVDLVDKEEEAYFNGALSALGELGTKDEALFLASYLDREDLSDAQKQSLMRVLGKIKAVETFEKLADIAQNEDANSFVRMYAAEAIGAMEVEAAEDILTELYESNDANLRVYVIKGLSHFDDEKANEIIIQALRDNQYKVRMEAISVVKDKKMMEAVPYIIYRCKHKDEDKAVKEKGYETLAQLNDEKGNEFLIGLLKDKKMGDATKAKISGYLLEANHCGTEEIIALAKDTLNSEVQKTLRYSLGKEFAKYGRPEFEEICSLYIDSKDVATQGTGLDIWAKGRYASVRPKVVALAKELDEVEKSQRERDEAIRAAKNDEEMKKARMKPVKKGNANSTKAKRILQQIDSITGQKETEKVDVVSGAQVSSESSSSVNNSDAK